MTQKKATCPHCYKVNVFTEPSVEQKLVDSLPVGIAKAIGVAVITAALGAGAGLIATGALFAEKAVRYFDGVEVSCGGCGKKFKVSS